MCVNIVLMWGQSSLTPLFGMAGKSSFFLHLPIRAQPKPTPLPYYPKDCNCQVDPIPSHQLQGVRTRQPKHLIIRNDDIDNDKDEDEDDKGLDNFLHQQKIATTVTQYY